MTLVEVLTSMLVLAVGVLGMLSVQSNAVKLMQNSYSQGQAAMLAHDLADRMRANAAAATATNSYVHSFDAAKARQGKQDSARNCSSSSCTGSQLADYDLQHWQHKIDRALPGAVSVVERTATAGSGGAKTDDFLITLRWDDDRSGSTGTECDPARRSADDLDCWQMTVSFQP
jgi:type IV pilus assembly protein PilV